jgi:anti-sigma-K factor RskA
VTDQHRENEIAAFVLGALDEGEAAVVCAHLEECSSCRAEYERLRVAADALPLAVEQYESPAGVGRRLMTAVRSEAQPTMRWSPRRLFRGQALALPALAVALVVVILALAGVFSSGGPGQRTITGQVIGTPGASVVLRIQGGRGQLVIASMAPPPAGHIYEVWIQRAGGPPQPTDALFGVSRDGAAVVAVPGNLQGVRQVLVTAEPLGGSPHPTRPAVIVVRSA